MSLKNKKIAIMATDGFEKSELFEPYNKLKEKGASVEIISNKSDEIKSWNDGNWGKSNLKQNRYFI
jgi:protease I